ncbi:MAG: nicotinate (nicotinamide) nucleotide adenylyltransferase [Erysipelotrichaceae bacterium]
MKRVACIGGSFNPPHYGHLKIALAILRTYHFDEVWFLPTIQSPLKDEILVSFTDRVEMLKLLIKPYRKLHICEIELQMTLPNYTIHTVEALMLKYPDYQFTWVIGSDQAQQFHQWHQAECLIQMIPFICVVRNESDQIIKPMIQFKFEHVLPFSSTKIKQGDLTMTNPAIRSYIMRYGLYKETVFKSFYSVKRFKHAGAMKDLALDLALHYHLDLTRVEIAALAHDMCKDWSDEQLKQWLSFCNPSYLDQPKAIWHQQVAAVYLSRVFNLRDTKILIAIKHHSDGNYLDSIAAIIYIADKCDSTRGYDASAIIQLAYKNLSKAVKYIQNEQLTYREGKALHD